MWLWSVVGNKDHSFVHFHVMYLTNSAADSIYMSYILIIPEKTRSAVQILFRKSLEIGGSYEVTC